MSVATRREREREQRRQHFIDTAERLFLDRGHDGVSIEEIAHAAEFSKRTVYLYFRDKRELYHAVVLRRLARLNRLLAGCEGRPGIDRLRELAWTYYRFFQRERPSFDLLLDFEMRDYHYSKRGGGQGEWENRCQQMNDLNSELVHRAVSEAMAQGADAGGLSPLQVTLVLWSQMVGILQIIARREAVLASAYGLTPEEFFQAAFEASLAGIFQRPGKATAP